MWQTVIVMVSTFITPLAYVLSLFTYIFYKIRYRTSIYIVRTGQELPAANAENIMVVTRYRYYRLISYLRFLGGVYVLVAVNVLFIIWAYYPPGGNTGPLTLLGAIIVTALVMFAGCVLRSNTMKNEIDGFLDANGYDRLPEWYVSQEIARLKALEKQRTTLRSMRDSSFTRIINNNVVDKLLPERFSDNRLVRKATGMVIREIITKLLVTAMLIILGIKSLR